jgi:multiple sugar transport system ATP-binding protein
MEVVLEGVSKTFGATQALHTVDIQIRDGEFVSLLGPSGSGKSTLLRLLAGLERPDAGVIRFDGRPVQHEPANKRDIAMVFQTYALYPHLTVEGNLAFPLRMQGTKREVVQQRVQETASLLGIGHLLRRKPRELSGGQRQRVALGRAMVRKPGLFLLDEPLSNLDAQMRVAMRTEIKRLHSVLQTTFVYVTHDQAEALTMSDRVGVLHDGRLQQVGTPSQVYRSPANRFVAQFIGSPPMVAIDGVIELRSDGRRFVANALSLDLPDHFSALPAAPVTLGIRPEDVLVCKDPVRSAVNALVYTREPMGPDLYLTLKVEGVLLRARADAELSVEEGDSVGITFRTERLQLFDPNTGASIPTNGVVLG